MAEKKYIIDNPILLAEWNWEKNTELNPAKITLGSGKKVWWKCSKDHEWESVIGSRKNGVGCPYCANKKVLQGFNDLATINPDLAKEWDHEKNGDLKPEHFTANSGKKVWWVCKKGHEWPTTIAHRNNGRGCPICKSERNTSFPEYAILYYLDKYGFEATHLHNAQGYELDVYIPSKKIAIEYDGSFWHKNKKIHDLEKNFQCKNDGIKLYRIRESLPPLNDTSMDYIIRDSQNDLSKVLKKILDEITELDVDINLERDLIDIESLREHSEKKCSLLFSNPNLAKEWNFEKNGNLKPENFFANSGKKVWWKCAKGHEWQATLAHRNSQGRGCPYCTGQKVIKGVNDLKTLNPNLAKEWNYEKNGGLTPENVMPNTHKKVWWKCAEGHEWDAVVSNRNRGIGCPYCSNKKTLSGFNDLQTINPVLAKEWNHDKNGELTPAKITIGSNKKVWWECADGHEWQATIASRNGGNGCPYCAGKNAIKGFNDLQTVNPSLASEWNYDKNNGLTPADVMPNSGKKVWWKCSKGHEWQSNIDNRSKGTGCPYCSGLYVVKGENDLLTINPDLAKEWSYEKNGKLIPIDVSPNSSKKVWWKCSKGHEWQANICSRNKGAGCPYCSGRYRIKGDNDLLTVNPTLANEWDYEKNSELNPVDVSPHSHKKVWWKCSKVHEWQATIKNRNYGTGCPYCAGRKR